MNAVILAKSMAQKRYLQTKKLKSIAHTTWKRLSPIPKTGLTDEKVKVDCCKTYLQTKKLESIALYSSNDMNSAKSIALYSSNDANSAKSIVLYIETTRKS